MRCLQPQRTAPVLWSCVRETQGMVAPYEQPRGIRDKARFRSGAAGAADRTNYEGYEPLADRYKALSKRTRPALVTDVCPRDYSMKCSSLRDLLRKTRGRTTIWRYVEFRSPDPCDRTRAAAGAG